jgi:hypothetical protein
MYYWIYVKCQKEFQLHEVRVCEVVHEVRVELVLWEGLLLRLSHNIIW